MPAHVLVVDDDPLTCELIREILCSAGMEAASLTDSTEAASRLRTEKFHAIFLDVRMPPPDGIELARQVRASRVNASTIIVMITKEEDRTVMKRAFEVGVEFLLFWPVERNTVVDSTLVDAGNVGFVSVRQESCTRVNHGILTTLNATQLPIKFLQYKEGSLLLTKIGDKSLAVEIILKTGECSSRTTKVFEIMIREMKSGRGQWI